MNRYIIAVEKNNEYGYDISYIGPWSLKAIPTTYTNFMDALELVNEWGLNNKGYIRKYKKIGIYDNIDDVFYCTEVCLKIYDYIANCEIFGK